MYDIEDIAKIADQSQRLSEVRADCYNQSEELMAMEAYCTDAMNFPFACAGYLTRPPGILAEKCHPCGDQPVIPNNPKGS